MNWAEELVINIGDLHIALKLLFLTLSVMIEYIFPIFPGDTIVLLAGFLNAKGALDLREIFISITIGSILGSLIAYWAGCFFGGNAKKYRWTERLKNSQAFHKFNTWFHRFGPLFLLFNRFFHGIRAIFFVAAGIVRIPLFKVLILGGLGAIIYNICLLLLGYWLGFNSDLILEYVYNYSIVFFIIFFFFLSLFIIYLWYQFRSSSKK